MPQDYPDGMTRMLPGHTIDLESGFALPWYEGGSVVIAAGKSGSYTLDFSDDDGIYYIDVVNVSPSAYKEFTVIVHINDVPYVCGSVMGFFFFNLRLNPSLLFISGDSVKVEILNLDAAQQTFSVKLNGTKIIRPPGFGKIPGAFFSVSTYGIQPGGTIVFTDETAYNPTSWDWDFGDGSDHSTEQNPSHVYTEAGSYTPILTARNAHGYDTYALSTPIVVTAYEVLTGYTEVDPGSDFTIDSLRCLATNMDYSLDAYVYKDFGSGYFNALTHRFVTLLSSVGSDSPAMYVYGLANAVGTLYEASGIKILVYWARVSTAYNLYVRCYNGTTVVATDYASLALNTPYYIEVIHTVGSNTITVKIYSDASYSVLVDTLTISNAVIATTWRYLYVMSAVGIGTTIYMSGYSEKFLLA